MKTHLQTLGITIGIIGVLALVVWLTHITGGVFFIGLLGVIIVVCLYVAVYDTAVNRSNRPKSPLELELEQYRAELAGMEEQNRQLRQEIAEYKYRLEARADEVRHGSVSK